MPPFKPMYLGQTAEWLENFLENILTSDPSTPISQDDLNDALKLTVYNEYIDSSELLLSRGAKVTDIVMFIAARRYDLSFFEMFLRHGWDVNCSDYRSPALKVVLYNEECVKWLLERGADPNKGGSDPMTRSPPLVAASSCNLSTIKPILDLLIAHGATVTTDALSSAMKNRGEADIPVMRYLIEHNVDVNGWLREWGTPLHLAVWLSRSDMVEVLLESGADMDARGYGGHTPVEDAVEGGKWEIVDVFERFLVSRGSNT